MSEEMLDLRVSNLEPVVTDHIQRVIDLEEQNKAQDARLAALESEVAALRARVEALEDRLHKVEGKAARHLVRQHGILRNADE